MDSRQFFPRPRGRGRKGHYWNHRKGMWIRQTTSDMFTNSISRIGMVYKHHIASPNNLNVTAVYNRESEEMKRAEEEENERMFIEESNRLQEMEKKKKEEEHALQQANAKRDAEERLNKKRFMQPHDSAYEIYERSNRQIPVYWCDLNGNFYECPAQPYEKPEPTKRERPYVWKTKMVDKIVTYKDDPITLAEGEWEYRLVSVKYKSYDTYM